MFFTISQSPASMSLIVTSSIAKVFVDIIEYPGENAWSVFKDKIKRVSQRILLAGMRKMQG
jgi:hypothetical protein